MTPTARSLAELRRLGFMADVCERWIALVGIRRDLFHCIDIVAVKAGEPILGVQATSASNLSSRLNKVRSLPAMRTWLAAGGSFECWGWALWLGRWHMRRVVLTLESLTGVEAQSLPKRRRPRRGERQKSLFAELN